MENNQSYTGGQECANKWSVNDDVAELRLLKWTFPPGFVKISILFTPFHFFLHLEMRRNFVMELDQKVRHFATHFVYQFNVVSIVCSW